MRTWPVRKLGEWLVRYPGVTAVLARMLVPVEKMVKVPVWDCRMCGQCVLHYTGMVCPMTCPKNLRNGPCGGVRLDGHCEVKPEMECVWLRAYEGSLRWPWPEEFHELRAPVDWRLKGTSSWVNYWTGRDEIESGCAREPHTALEVVDANE